MNIITANIYFGFSLTILIYVLAVFINRKWKYSITSPFLLTVSGVIGFLLLTDIPYPSYYESAKFLNFFLIPATVCFAVPMYKQLKLMREYKWVVLASILAGGIASVGTIVFLCWAFGLLPIIMQSLVSISATTPIAIGISKELGGIAALTAFAAIATGIFGHAVGRQLSDMLGITNPVARGLALGTSSHIAGASRALEIGEKEGAFGSLAVVVTALMIATLAPIAIYLFN